MATENHVFVNRGLERQVRERQVTRLSHAWTILKARFDTTTYYSNNPTLLSSFPKDMADYYKMAEAATIDARTLVEILEETKPEPIYGELTPEEYKRQFEGYRPDHTPHFLSMWHFYNMTNGVPTNVDTKPLEAAMNDAIWLIETCKLDVDIENKHSPRGSYMAFMKRLAKKFKASDITPPTYQEGARFNAMLYFAQAATNANTMVPKKRKAGDE